MMMVFVICGHLQAAISCSKRITTANHAAHDGILAAHLGVAKTYEVIRQRFYWFNMFHDIQNIITTFNIHWYI